MRISDWSSDVCSSDLIALDEIFEGNPNYMGCVYREQAPTRLAPGQFIIINLDDVGGAGTHWEIGRASCRERVCQYVSISVVAVSLKKKYNKKRRQCDTRVS